MSSKAYRISGIPEVPTRAGARAGRQSQLDADRSLRQARDPLPPRAAVKKKLKGYRPPLCRLGTGGYRVLYRVAQRPVTVLRVIDRRDLDRLLETL